MLMNTQDLFENAVQTGASNRALWEIAARLLDAGTTHDELYSELEVLMLRLRSEGREADEDRIMDVMDYVVGWCGPAYSLASRGH
jgi:hypothetical protein